MRSLFHCVFVAVFIASLEACRCSAQDSNNNVLDPMINQAVQTLQTNRVMLGPLEELSYVDPEKRKIAGQLYTAQMGAISLLGNAKILGTAAFLIPYLNYPSTDFSPAVLHIEEPHPEDISKTRKLWPAFSAILEIPGASKALSTYALDKANPVNFRFSAFCALRYLDMTQCIVVGNELGDEFSSSKKALFYIRLVENGTMRFNGANFSP